MKIKVAKDSVLMNEIQKYDRERYREEGHFGGTWFSDYSPKWEEEDVTLEKLEEYAKNGYAIKINCK